MRTPRKAIFLPPKIHALVEKAANGSKRTIVKEIEYRFEKKKGHGKKKVSV